MIFIKNVWSALQGQIEECGWEEGREVAIDGTPATYRPHPFGFVDSEGKELQPAMGLPGITVDGIPILQAIGIKLD